MQLFSLTFLAVGLAADAFAVSLTSGLSIKNIKINKALKIALFFGGFQALMPFLGWLMGLTIRDWIAQFDHWLAFGILAAIGSKMLYEACQEDDEDCKPFNPLDSYTLLVLAIATSIDALAVGVGLSVLGDSILRVCAFIGIVTFGLSFVGVFIGHRFGCVFSQKVEILGGVILILLGIKLLVEGLGVWV
jgi:putative Mn2+ efflux pump MntP